MNGEKLGALLIIVDFVKAPQFQGGHARAVSLLQRLRRTCYRWWRESSESREIVSGKLFMHTVRGGAFPPVVLLVVSFVRTM
jgi:hypothetical protein